MQNDLKIGLILGLVIVCITGLWLATRPELVPQARLFDLGDNEKQVQDQAQGMRESRIGVETRASATSSRQINRSDSTIRPSSPEPESATRRIVNKIDIERSRPTTPAVNVESEEIKPQRFHIVRQGETLSKISFDYYGTSTKWQKILEANSRTIKNADTVKIGTKLIIPD